MLSDALGEADKAIREEQIKWPELYDTMKPRLDVIRAHMVVIQMELDNPLPRGWLEKNPIYVAAKAGDVSVSDRYMDGDDSMLTDFRAELAKVFPPAR